MTATDTTALEAVLRRDRAVVVTALVAVITIAWIWILLGAGTGMTALDMARGSGAPGMAGMMVAPASCTRSSGSSTAASSRSAVIMVRLRSQRSAKTPATAPSSTRGA